MRLLTMILVGAVLQSAQVAAQEPDWREDWEVNSGFAISIDSTGYSLPVQLAVVPEPGPDPNDPLYYVIELRGAVKVVTNSREVRDFASVDAAKPDEELPSMMGEIGAAGICLAPETGDVFVTFAYRDEAGAYRNNIARFSTGGAAFGLKPTGKKLYTEIFIRDYASVSHQIGPCQVDEGLLYVAVGDGEFPLAARTLGSTGGKVLRMTLEGEAVPENPFWEESQQKDAKNYVWALGFRNPFGLHVRGGRVLVSDNGPALDRFLEVSIGEDCLYDGTDWSIGARADLIFSPSVSPVALDHYRADFNFFPKSWNDHIFMALSGSPSDRFGIGSSGRKSVVAFAYDFERRQVTKTPQVFLRYRGDGAQLPVGLAFGSDGLFVVPLYPDGTGQSPILRVYYDPERPHPYDTRDIKKYRDKAAVLMQDRGCFSCHTLIAGVDNVGPTLDRATLKARVSARLKSPEYRELVSDLDLKTDEFWVSYKDQRQAILAATGREQVILWMKTRLQEPRFDNPTSQMPNLGLSAEEIDIIVGFLLPEKTIRERIQEAFGAPRHRYWMMALVVGGAVGLMLGSGLVWFRFRRS